ncbi:hypothetical protein THAOC_37453, partial [Thalassiosira oceanica]
MGFREEIEYVSFCGKCILPGGVIREGQFRLVDPIMRMILCGQFGKGYQSERWEIDMELGCHNLKFDDWVDRQIDLLTQLKCQSTTPLEKVAEGRGREMAKAGELILETYEFKKSRATLGADGLIYHWTAPLQDTLLREGHHLCVEYVESRFIYTVEGLIYHWSRPLRDSLEPLRESNLLGMKCGDIESASLSLNFYLA